MFGIALGFFDGYLMGEEGPFDLFAVEFLAQTTLLVFEE